MTLGAYLLKESIHAGVIRLFGAVGFSSEEYPPQAPDAAEAGVSVVTGARQRAWQLPRYPQP